MRYPRGRSCSFAPRLPMPSSSCRIVRASTRTLRCPHSHGSRETHSKRAGVPRQVVTTRIYYEARTQGAGREQKGRCPRIGAGARNRFTHPSPPSEHRKTPPRSFSTRSKYLFSGSDSLLLARKIRRQTDSAAMDSARRQNGRVGCRVRTRTLQWSVPGNWSAGSERPLRELNSRSAPRPQLRRRVLEL